MKPETLIKFRLRRGWSQSAFSVWLGIHCARSGVTRAAPQKSAVADSSPATNSNQERQTAGSLWHSLAKRGTVMKANGYPWRVSGVLLLCAVCGVASSFPFVFSLYADLLAKSPVPLPILILLGLLQNSVILALVTGFGLFLTAKVGLPGAPFIEGWLSGKSTEERFRTIIQPALIMGVGVGATLLVLFFLVLKNELPQLPLGKAALLPLWRRLLVCVYGVLTEEVLMRLFLFSLLVWILGKVCRSDLAASGRPVFCPSNIILTSLF